MNKFKALLLILVIVSCNSKQEQKSTDSTTKTEIITPLSEHIMIGDQVKLSDYKLISNNSKTIVKDKLILIDFWATWCGPCIAGFPHLEEIQEKYKEKLQIIAVSDEENKKIVSFLEKKPFDLAFFTDDKKRLSGRFSIESLPTSCLLSKDGEFLWIGSSKNLESVLEQYFNENKINVGKGDFNHFKKYYAVTPEKKITNALFSYILNTANDPSLYMGTNSHKIRSNPADIEYASMPVSEVVKDFKLLDNFSRLKNNREELDTILVDIYAKSSHEKMTNAMAVETILDDLQQIYDFTITENNVLTDVYHLKVIDTIKLNSFIEPTEGGGMVDNKNGQHKILRLKLDQLAGLFEGKLRSSDLILYEGNDDQKYTFIINHFNTIQELNIELKKVGLFMQKGKSNIKFIEIN